MPRVKLQDRMVASLEGGDGRVDYWDALVPGLVRLRGAQGVVRRLPYRWEEGPPDLRHVPADVDP
jgi:hypothetical protein